MSPIGIILELMRIHYPEAEMTPDVIAGLESQSQAAIAEAHDALLAARAACTIAVLQYKLPSEVLTSASVIAIFPELLSTTRRNTGVPGVCIERKIGVPARVHLAYLEGPGIDFLRLPGGLVFIVTKTAVAQAFLAGRSLGAEIPVTGGPVNEDESLDARSVLCWFFSAGDVRATTVVNAAVRLDHRASDRNSSPPLSALSTALCRARRRSESRSQPAAEDIHGFRCSQTRDCGN